MTLFDGSFPFYPNTRTSFPFNATWAVIISVFLTILATFILILPGIRGKGRFFWLLRVVTSLFIGAVILSVNFSRDWETGRVTANTPYKSFSRAVVNADVGLHIGLEGINVTLLGNPVNQINETINYNEHFAWHLGADYAQIYAEGLAKGLPSPILYVAEKFSRHSPCGMYSQYRISGHYTSITLWLAFCTWLISNMLFAMPVLLYGGYMILLTAVLMICSLLFFSIPRNSPMCAIQFGPASLQTVYGESFWLTLATGLLCFLLGLGVIVMNSVQPEKLKLVFNLREEEEGGKEEEDEGPAERPPRDKASSSEQDVLLAPQSEHCKVTVTAL
ncbi:dual oxidase maturation factor 1 [Emydura macquarii macquarii]|uniref:dual oxidase maturation factor 1 n=1 Tax=Emydura macquarii macquarii TaxID=1129001 RepID=UPI00352B6EAA